MEDLPLPAYCLYHVIMGFSVAAGVHLFCVVVAQFRHFVGDALRGK